MTTIEKNMFSDNYQIELVSVPEALRKHFGHSKLREH